MISIIMTAKDGKEITQVSIDSIRKYTTEPYELIVVNDGSKKETTDYLESLKDIIYIKNETNLGWCKAINQGIEKSKGEFVVFSNNDVVVTPNWDKKLLRHFELDKKLGVLGPISSKVNGFQHIDFNKEGVNFHYTDALMFFFTMVRREVIDKIGGLDERFGIGGQDDTDYCIRARDAKFMVGIARDTFVYHYGSATYREMFHHNNEYSKEFSQSRRKILENKYGRIVDGRKKRIFIAVPNMGTIIPELATNLIQWTHDPRYEVKIFMPKNIQPMDCARNSIVKEFLELDFDYLFWIDDDVTCAPDTLHKLIEHDKDIVSAAPFCMQYEGGETFPYVAAVRFNEHKKYKLHHGKGLEKVDAIGGGCILYKRKVYEAKELERPYEFTYHRDGTRSVTCDFNVHEKAHKAGFETWVDFGLLCSHFKEVDLKQINNLLVRVKNGG